MTKASVKYKLQYTFSDTSWSRITKTKNLKLKFWTNLHKISVLVSSVWVQGWCSGESTRLPPMWPGFKSRRRRHMWVEFVVGSLPCSERFFSGYSGFPVSSKTNISKFQFDQESGRRRTTMWMCYLQIVIYFILFIYLFILFLSAVQGCTCSYKERLSMLFNNSSWHFYTTSPSKLPLFHFPEQFELVC